MTMMHKRNLDQFWTPQSVQKRIFQFYLCSLGVKDGWEATSMSSSLDMWIFMLKSSSSQSLMSILSGSIISLPMDAFTSWRTSIYVSLDSLEDQMWRRYSSGRRWISLLTYPRMLHWPLTWLPLGRMIYSASGCMQLWWPLITPESTLWRMCSWLNSMRIDLSRGWYCYMFLKLDLNSTREVILDQISHSNKNSMIMMRTLRILKLSLQIQYLL